MPEPITPDDMFSALEYIRQQDPCLVALVVDDNGNDNPIWKPHDNHTTQQQCREAVWAREGND